MKRTTRYGSRTRVLAKLGGGDRRSIGRSPEVVREVLGHPALLAELAAGIWHPDTVVRVRASDELEKVSRPRPGWLAPLRGELLRLAGASADQEVRWHLAQLLPRLRLSHRQRQDLAWVLDRYAIDSSAIVRVSALQALADLAVVDVALRAKALARIRAGVARGTPAVRARARKLLGRLEWAI